ncbi:MAG: 2-succinyl-5-enolpyruvyl-6-hydroxy-3-cyclohexene-1-carboxylic-acid synthase, partial [Chloroflexi bacterium]|nr:2-succinyl-5-enolpyruvyl-6-hydroxy-3-cyclohexene-1-carboxylic-acid synthase [Chloroflexota bacterium]
RAVAGRRGVLLCGPAEPPPDPPALVALAEALGWPVVADPISGMRAGAHPLDAIVETADLLAREPAFVARAAPEVVIRLGAAPTSKPLAQWLAGLPEARPIVVDPAGGWRDPDLAAGALIEADETAFCEALRRALPSAGARADGEWGALWREANLAARRALRTAVEQIEEPFEGRAALALADALPDGATLVVGNSMPIRDVDSFFPVVPRRLRLLGTRGASGIDGVVSTAVGAAAARGGPVALLVGDLSLLHDLNGLWPLARHGLDLTVVLLNNDGGGIFHFLAQRDAVPAQFETWFGTPHGLDLRHAVALHGGRHAQLDGRDWDASLAAALARPGLDVLELRTERDRNVALHRRVWERAAAAVREAVTGAGVAGS